MRVKPLTRPLTLTLSRVGERGTRGGRIFPLSPVGRGTEAAEFSLPPRGGGKGWGGWIWPQATLLPFAVSPEIPSLPRKREPRAQ